MPDVIMREIEAAMLALADIDDPEKAHYEADKLLVAALRENVVWGSANNVDEIIEAWEAVTTSHQSPD